MQVRETLKAEMNVLIKDLISKIDIPEGCAELSVNEIFDLAEKQGKFSQSAYVYSDDEEVLEDILVFSIGMSRLWREKLKEDAATPRTYVNVLIIEFMKHMWGLEKVAVSNESA